MFPPWLYHLRRLLKPPVHVAELLPWDRTVAEGVILLKDESLMHTLRVQPPDLDALSRVERSEVILQMNRAWQRFEPGWAIWNEAMRLPVHETLAETFTNPAARLVDQSQRAQATHDTRWRTTQYLTLCHKPEVFEESKLSRVFYTGSPAVTVSLAKRFDMFCDQVEQFTDLLKACSATIEHLGSDAQQTYLHQVIADHDQPVTAHELGTDLDYRLADTEVWGGITPKLGDQYVKIVSLRNFPATTRERIFAAMERWGFRYRWVVRWLPKSRQDAAKDFSDRQSGWRATSMSIGQWMYEQSTQRDSGLKHSHVDRQASDADQANDEVLSELVGYGQLSQMLVLMHADRGVLQEQVRQALSLLRGAGCVAVVERLNAFEAWISTWPGCTAANVRKYTLSTLNVIHLSRHSAPALGADPARALCMATTERVVPFPVDLRVGQVEHTLVLGRTESGKSTLMNFLDSQHLRREDAQVFIIEFQKQSARSMVLCHGGVYQDLARGLSGYQPLAHIDQPTQRAWAQAWLSETILKLAKVELNTITHGFLDAGLERLSKQPRSQRTLTELSLALAAQDRGRQRNQSLVRYVGTDTRDMRQQDAVSTLHEAVQDALEPFTSGHVYGHLLDGHDDAFGNHGLQGLSFEPWLKVPTVLEPLFSYIWHAILQRLDGRPTHIRWDECSFGLKIPFVYASADEGLRILREKRAGLILGTQNPLDIIDSTIGPLLLDNCMTRILAPNTEATDPKVRLVYEALGLNETLIERLALEPPQQSYLLCQGSEKRFITLKLSHVAQVILASSSPEAHARMDEVERTRGDEPFLDAWLRANGLKGDLYEVAAD